MSGCPTAALIDATIASNGLEEVRLILSTSTFLVVIILFLMVVAMEKVGTGDVAKPASASFSALRRLIPPLPPVTSAVLLLPIATLLHVRPIVNIGVSALIYDV